MKPRVDISVGLLLIQVLGSWGRSSSRSSYSSYRGSYRVSYYSSGYVFYTGGYYSSSNYDNSYIGDMPFPKWAKNPKGAAALYIFYNLTYEGPPYRETFATLTSGQFCTNNQGFIFDNVSYSMGRFQCPVDGFTTDDVYCCGDYLLEYCCQLLDDPGRRNLIIDLPISGGILIAAFIAYLARVYCRKRGKNTVAVAPVQASSVPDPSEVEMAPVSDSSMDPSMPPPPPPPPQTPFTIDSAYGYPDVPPPPPFLNVPNAAMPPAYGEATSGFYYSYTSTPPSAENPTDSAPPSYEEVTHAPRPYLSTLSPNRNIDYP